MADETPTPPVIDDGDFGDSLTTIFINRFYMRTGGLASRVSFGELVDIRRQVGWRVAFMMANGDLEALAHLILDQLGKTHPPQPSEQGPLGAGTQAIIGHGKQ